MISEDFLYAHYIVYATIRMLHLQHNQCGWDKRCFLFDGKQLVGFFNLIDEETEVFFGIGVAPDCCNKGYGREICEEALELSRELYPGKTIYLEVRTWNARAVKCYEKAGFSIDGEPIKQTTSIGEGVFYRMVAH
jgi:ribosomal protein S18 acetylase RimI-like enzyme